MILDGGFLFRAQHFKQRRSRGTAEVGRNLVYFVEKEDGVLGSRALHVLNDLSWQCADVRAAVTANLGLVPHSAQREPHKLAACGLRNRHEIGRASFRE